MKSNKLKLFIRKIVREEVAMAIHEVITELKQPPQLKQKSQTRIDGKKTYSSNSILNDVLNETAQHSAEWKTMGTDVYDTSKMDELISSQATPTLDMETAAGMGIDLHKVNDSSMDFMTKDYSAVLKKSYEKSGKI